MAEEFNKNQQEVKNEIRKGIVERLLGSKLDTENSIKLHEAELEKEYTEKLNEKNSEIKDLKNRLDNNSLEIKNLYYFQEILDIQMI